MNKISEFLLTIWGILRYPIMILIISIITGLFFDNGYVGFFTAMGIIAFWGLFNILRQMWWYFTNTGDYEKKDSNKKG